MKVFVFGAGKVGRALAHALEERGVRVTLRPARKGLPKKPIDADVVVLAVRDRALEPLAEELASSGIVKKKAVVVHNAGARSADVLRALAPVTAGVAQMHPMISFASRTSFPTLTRGNVHVQGDAAAVTRARRLAKKLGMSPRTFPGLDTVGYHAAAGIVANGAAALSAMGAKLLEASGVPASDAPKLLGPLLRSVADNVEALGFPDALTGPVRRGDAAGIGRQIDLLRERFPELLPIYLASTWAQLPIARTLGEAPPKDFDAIEHVLVRAKAWLDPTKAHATKPRKKPVARSASAARKKSAVRKKSPVRP